MYAEGVWELAWCVCVQGRLPVVPLSNEHDGSEIRLEIRKEKVNWKNVRN